MKIAFLTLILLVSSSAFADYQLICRKDISSSEQSTETFTFRGASSSFQQTKMVIHVKQVSNIVSNPNASVSNDDSFSNEPKFDRFEYSVLGITSSEERGSFAMDLAGGGNLRFALNRQSQKWDGFFVRPNGPEIAQIFSGCSLENPEIGFTARN